LDIKTIELIGSKIIDYPEIGKITYKRNIRARRLSISIRQTSGIRVTIPGTLSFRSAESFVLSKSQWIIEKVEYFNENSTKINQSGEYRTKKHTLIFIPTDSDIVKVRVKEPFINVYHPKQTQVSSTQVQLFVLKGIEHAFRIEAKEFLPQRVEYLASIHNFKYNKLSIKKTRTRWGSCSSNNNINLSIFLMKLPEHLIDYIIIHELCHTIHKNHGPQFWESLNQFTEGKAISLAKEVKKFRAGV